MQHPFGHIKQQHPWDELWEAHEQQDTDSGDTELPTRTQYPKEQVDEYLSQFHELHDAYLEYHAHELQYHLDHDNPAQLIRVWATALEDATFAFAEADLTTQRLHMGQRPDPA